METQIILHSFSQWLVIIYLYNFPTKIASLSAQLYLADNKSDKEALVWCIKIRKLTLFISSVYLKVVQSLQYTASLTEYRLVSYLWTPTRGRYTTRSLEYILSFIIQHINHSRKTWVEVNDLQHLTQALVFKPVKSIFLEK